MSKNDNNSKLDLGDAYNLGKPANHAEYYDRMAQSYDDEFVVEHQYIYPQIVAKHFLEVSGKNDQPVADLVAGLDWWESILPIATLSLTVLIFLRK